MAAVQSVILKRGATLNLAGYLNLPAGSWDATSEVKDAGGILVSDLTVVLTPPVSPNTLWTITLSQTADATLEWPLGPLSCDIRFTDGTNVLYTPTFTIFVQQEITDV